MAYAVVKELQRELGDSLRLVFRNMPLANVHPHAEAAAEAAEAVAEQGRFWEMHDLLYENQKDLGDAALARYATQAGADESAFSAAVQGGGPREESSAISKVRCAAVQTARPRSSLTANGTTDRGSWSPSSRTCVRCSTTDSLRVSALVARTSMFECRRHDVVNLTRMHFNCWIQMFKANRRVQKWKKT